MTIWGWGAGCVIQDEFILQERTIRMKSWEKSSSLYFSFPGHKKKGMEIQLENVTCIIDLLNNIWQVDMSNEACKRLWWHHQSNFRPGLRSDVDEPTENNGRQCQRLSSWVTDAYFLLHLRSLDLSFLSLVDSSQLSAQAFHESTAMGKLGNIGTCTQQ